MAEDDDAESRSFLADECTFTRTVRRMRDLGCAVNRVQDLGMAGASDAAVFQKAQENEAVLVTTEPEQIQAVHRALRHLLETEESFEGTLFIVDAHKYRKRKKP
jgi:hypothetical protein